MEGVHVHGLAFFSGGRGGGGGGHVLGARGYESVCVFELDVVRDRDLAPHVDACIFFEPFFSRMVSVRLPGLCRVCAGRSVWIEGSGGVSSRLDGTG